MLLELGIAAGNLFSSSRMTRLPRRPHLALIAALVIFVPFRDGRPTGALIDVLTGFAKANGDALGRPVGVAVDARGALLGADDVGNTVWRVGNAPKAAATTSAPPPDRRDR